MLDHDHGVVVDADDDWEKLILIAPGKLALWYSGLLSQLLYTP